MPMHVAIDLRLGSQRPGGIATYSVALTAALVALPSAPRVTALVRRALPTLPDAVRSHRVFTPAHHAWEDVAFGLESALVGADLLHLPDFIAPALRRVPAVVTIHDLAFLLLPEILGADGRRYYGRIHAAAERADHLIAVSESTKRDIVELLGLSARRVTVVPAAADSTLCPLSRPQLTALVAATSPRPEVAALALGERGDYVLCVGTLEPRKNLPLLIHAFERLVRDTASPPRLVLAGRLGWRADGIQATLARSPARQSIDWIDGPSDAELRALYAGALALAFPSLYEGFGLPALEAMACGLPVVASDTSALTELVAGAGLLLPPHDAAAWSEAIAALAGDEVRRAALSAAGLQRAAGFSWARAAAETKAVYERMLAHA